MFAVLFLITRVIRDCSASYTRDGAITCEGATVKLKGGYLWREEGD